MKIDRLTKEQEDRFPEFIAKWTDIGLSTAPADRPRAERAIAEMYAGAGLKLPRIVWCGSPLSQGLARDSVGASVVDSVVGSVGDSVRDSVRASVGDSVRDSVRDSVGDSVAGSVRASVGDSVRDSVRASVRDSVRDSVWDSVGDSVGASVGDSVRDSVYGSHDAGWLSFYDFFRDAAGLVEQTEKLHGLMELAKSAGWALPHKNICWISERHSILRRDDRGLLHCEDGPACAYPDGWAIYAWHGTRVPSEWITDRAKLAPQTALKWPQIEQRRAACEILGWETILSQLNAKVIDDDGDPEIGVLVEVTIPDIGKEKFLRVRCGTGRSFALPVPPNMKTALEAQAWTWGLDKTSFLKPEVRT